MAHKILFITLSNIGDAALTLPALDLLAAEYPDSAITVLTAPRPKELFENHPAAKSIIVYDKRAGAGDQITLVRRLRKERFNLVADLRNTFLGAALFAPVRIPICLRLPKNITHKRDSHLYKIKCAIDKRVFVGTEQCSVPTGDTGLPVLNVQPKDAEYIEHKLKDAGITGKDSIVVMAPGARSDIKKWPKEKFAELAVRLAKDHGVKIALAGDKHDAAAAAYIAENAQSPVIDLAGQTSLMQLAALLKRAALLVTNDSAILHLAGYLGLPAVAIFGPTDDRKYGPWPGTGITVKKEIACRPCNKAQCRFGTLECMNLIKVEDVLGAVKKALTQASRFVPAETVGTRSKDSRVFCPSRPASLYCSSEADGRVENTYKRILISRTDRIGDVVLSTPVIQALRAFYPDAYIAMMTSAAASGVVEGNPYLDAVFVYDKDGAHKSWVSSAKFAIALRKKKFDLCIILHPTNRAHLVAFFAGIKRRMGFDRKCAFLLTDRIKHTKQFGRMHEAEYNLELLKYLGIDSGPAGLYMPLKKESEDWAEAFLEKNGIKPQDKLLVIHPGASCPSKIWPAERFAEAADRLCAKYGFKTLVIAGPKDIQKSKLVLQNMRTPAYDLAGKTSVSQLASILKRCRLFISNDSGPVHIAGALSVPVVSIFGRAQSGLGPRRWGPLGPKGRYLHKNVGCAVCLAHNCAKGFVCLRSISVDDVCAAAEEII